MKVNLIRIFQVIAKFTSSGKVKVKYQGQNQKRTKENLNICQKFLKNIKFLCQYLKGRCTSQINFSGYKDEGLLTRSRSNTKVTFPQILQIN